MTNLCEIKRGFFVMQSCPNPVVKQCENCKKSACQTHLSLKSGSRYCADCAGKTAQSTMFSGYQDGDETDDYYYNDYWIYSYRSQYYGQGYRPFQYSQEDYGSFEQYSDDAEFNEDDDYAGDFYDS